VRATSPIGSRRVGERRRADRHPQDRHADDRRPDGQCPERRVTDRVVTDQRVTDRRLADRRVTDRRLDDRQVTDRRGADPLRSPAELTLGPTAPRRLAVVLAVVLLLTGAAHVGGTMLGPHVSVLDLGAEQSVGTWVTSVVHLLCAVLAGCGALVARNRGSRWVPNWLLLAAVFGAMSVDEVAAAHDRLLEPVRDLLGTTGVFYYAWVIPALVVGAVFLAVQVRFLAALGAATRRGLLVAGAVFVAGAAGLEMAEGWLASGGHRASALYDLLVMTEELLELGSIMAAACILLRPLLRELGTVRISGGRTRA